MLNKRSLVVIGLFIGIVLAGPLFSQNRSFDTLFPELDAASKSKVFSPRGLILSATGNGPLRLLPSASSGIDISSPVLKKKPSCLVEALLVIPHTETKGFIHIYNALAKIRNLKGRLYHSFTRDENIPLFEEATRIQSPRRMTPIPDSPDAISVPRSETLYIRLKDVNFGNSYYRADITQQHQGLLYSLSNFKSLSYLFIPVIKEGKFITQLYFEPLAEGVLVYSIAGADVSDFVASQVDIPSAIRKRLEVIIDWVVEGI
ncbi:MAG: hypothetical protein LBT14_03935 [Treponema sp.]|jgi:hypothetical protein|nr:hypothetical protein [Treponema sp.]